MKLNKHKLIYIWPQLKYLKIQLKIPQSDYINFRKKLDNTHIRFDRAHAPGPKLTSGLCLYIGLVASLATNTVKVMSNEAGLRLLCCGMCFTYIHLFEATHHNIKTFPKGFVE